jgi:hypothetical protein
MDGLAVAADGIGVDRMEVDGGKVLEGTSVGLSVEGNGAAADGGSDSTSDGV